MFETSAFLRDLVIVCGSVVAALGCVYVIWAFEKRSRQQDMSLIKAFSDFSATYLDRPTRDD